MLLGKRPRQPIRRTTSMTGITLDPNVDFSQPLDESQHPMIIRDSDLGQEQGLLNYHNNSSLINNSSTSDCNNRFLATLVSPRITHRENSADFLTTCGLCKRRLAAGKDIYMYRGDTAFCSEECREKQMKHDERKEKCRVVMGSKKDDVHLSSTTSSSKAAASSSSSRKTETVAAA